MIKSELDSLEGQIDNLINSLQQLTVENNILRKKISQLDHDHAILLDKKKKMAIALKQIITKLQDEFLCKMT
jgi:uncharacterized protein (TIGR02449 family)